MMRRAGVALVLVLVGVGCASTEDVGFTSVTSGETGGSETGGESGGPSANCADPEFEMGVLPEDPTLSECSGQGGGTLVFDVFSGLGSGVIPDRHKSNPTVFYPDATDVGACCGSLASDSEVEAACVSDCGRAACNIAIAELEAAVADPASLQGDGCGMDCALNVAGSIEDWILPQLKSAVGYQACMDMAALNIDPNVDYTAADYVGPELHFQRPGDACMAFGCLSNVRLRVYCAVDSVTPTEQACTTATNDEHPDIPPSERVTIAPSATQITSGPKDRSESYRALSHGGVLQRSICTASPCPVVLETFALSTDARVHIGSLEAWDLTAILEYAAVGNREGERIVFDPGALQLRISGVTAQDPDDATLPIEFVIANTVPITATLTRSTFAFDELVFSQGQDELRIRVDAAISSPLD